ncbi:MAG: hypothetical protein BGO49_10135 [Planctomycetales bacterium 71-10]|nr:MAG: hypothetical protein BGO49_10135 [Planctomycetales bacterium 71-10]
MRFGIGPGPVFAYEWLRISRRRSMYLVRAAAVAAVLLSMLTAWSPMRSAHAEMDRMILVAMGQAIAMAVGLAELTFLLLVAPAATAGAVCLDRARGALVQVMATDLTDSEIVLGKLAAALLPVAGLVAALLPVKMLGSLLGGVEPMAMFGSSAVALATAVLASTLAFSLSVWGRKPHEVLSAAYLILLAWIGAPILFELATVPLRDGLPWVRMALWRAALASNPYNHMSPEFNEVQSDYLTRVGVFAGVCLAVSALLALATTLGIRRAVLTTKDHSEASLPRRAWPTLRLPSILPAPSLDANPVLWREWSRSRPSPAMRYVWGFYVLLALSLATASLSAFPQAGVRARETPTLSTMILVGVGLLLLSARAATSLSEERARGSLDVLMSTPMTTPEILAGKWWGTFRLVPSLIFLPALLAYLSTLMTDGWLVYLLTVGYLLACGAALTGLGLAFSVWIPHQGRALAMSMGGYVAMALGPLLLAMVVDSRPGGHDGEMLAVGCPIYGSAAGMIYAFNPGPTPYRFRDALPYCLASWGVFYACVATGAYLAACLTFDRCLGRAASPEDGEALREHLRALRPRFGRGREPAAAAEST